MLRPSLTHVTGERYRAPPAATEGIRHDALPSVPHDNPSQAKFRLECGARLAVTCPQCGSELPPSATFCLKC